MTNFVYYCSERRFTMAQQFRFLYLEPRNAFCYGEFQNRVGWSDTLIVGN